MPMPAACRHRRPAPFVPGLHPRQWIGAGLVAAACQAAQAGYPEGLEAGRRGDFAAALHELQPLAENGQRDAQRALADMYLRGLGVKQDDQPPCAWYRQAADQGDAHAQTDLGWMYEQGRGVPRDFDEAG